MDQIQVAIQSIAAIGLMVGFLLAPVALIVGVFWAARRRMLGRHSHFDGIFGGMARANGAQNDLVAGIPDRTNEPQDGR
jgi:hypothetical protein